MRMWLWIGCWQMSMLLTTSERNQRTISQLQEDFEIKRGIEFDYYYLSMYVEKGCRVPPGNSKFGLLPWPTQTIYASFPSSLRLPNSES